MAVDVFEVVVEIFEVVVGGFRSFHVLVLTEITISRLQFPQRSGFGSNPCPRNQVINSPTSPSASAEICSKFIALD